jgi:hypothetical protein
MADPRRVELQRQLEQLAQEVAADGGATLHLADGDGILQMIASTATPAPSESHLLARIGRNAAALLQAADAAMYATKRGERDAGRGGYGAAAERAAVRLAG